MSKALLFEPLTLPCGVSLHHRIAKSAMSDSLGDGTGHPSPQQIRLYNRWSGVAASIVGEVQTSPKYAEKPGNLVLNEESDLERFSALAASGKNVWLQIGHAGALAFEPTSPTLRGPSALDYPELKCEELSLAEIQQFPIQMAATAKLAQSAGFAGVQIHAAHGFLLSQFLSPLFNKRVDAYGSSSIKNRVRLLLECIEATRNAVGPKFPIAVKLNSTDQLEGGLTENDALQVVAALDDTSIDLLDISGGTYFPGAKAASDGASAGGPYFLEFCKRARLLTQKPLMLTGGVKTYAQAMEALQTVDVIGLARALVLEPSLPDIWKGEERKDPVFPRFSTVPPPGGITAWYTMRLTDIGEDKDAATTRGLEESIVEYDERDKARTEIWRQHFGMA